MLVPGALEESWGAGTALGPSLQVWSRLAFGQAWGADTESHGPEAPMSGLHRPCPVDEAPCASAPSHVAPQPASGRAGGSGGHVRGLESVCQRPGRWSCWARWPVLGVQHKPWPEACILQGPAGIWASAAGAALSPPPHPPPGCERRAPHLHRVCSQGASGREGVLPGALPVRPPCLHVFSHSLSGVETRMVT